MRLRPSIKQGFARNAATAKYPNLWRGCVGAWCPCLGHTGQQLIDFSGFGNHAAFVGTPTWVLSHDTDSRNPSSGYAINFTGTSDDCQCNQRVIDTSTPHSYTAWVKRAADGADHHIVYAGSNQSRLRIANNDTVQYRTNGDNTQSSGTVLVADGWTHIGVSWDGATVNLWINGLNDGTEVKSADSGATATSISEATANAMNGLIDDVRIYDRALTPSEWFQLCEIGRGGSYELRDVFALAGETEVAAPGADQEVLHHPKLVDSLVLGHLVG